MRKFIIIPELHEGTVISVNDPFVRIMLELPAEATGFYCSRDYSKKHPQLLEELDGRGIPIVYDTLDGISSDTVVVSAAEAKIFHKEKLAEIKRLGAKVLCYLDPTEEIGISPSTNEFFLYNSETQMFLAMPGGRFSLDEQGSPEVGLMPDGGQAGAVGLLRSDNILEDREEDKVVLKARLAEIMKTDFSPELPLVLHFLNHQNVLADMDRGLSRLGDKVNLLIKGIHWHEGLEDIRSKAKGEHIFFFNRHSHYYNRLLRYASDFFMPGCFSGALPTSLMMGLRIIPIYTQLVYPTGAHYQRKTLVSFSKHMRAGFIGIPLKIMDHLPPICMEATDMLIDRIFDSEYWDNYDRQLPQIQRAVFGRYLLGEAAVQRAKGFVFRLLNFGGFVPPNVKGAVSVPHPLHTDSGLPPL